MAVMDAELRVNVSIGISTNIVDIVLLGGHCTIV